MWDPTKLTVCTFPSAGASRTVALATYYVLAEHALRLESTTKCLTKTFYAHLNSQSSRGSQPIMSKHAARTLDLLTHVWASNFFLNFVIFETGFPQIRYTSIRLALEWNDPLHQMRSLPGPAHTAS